MQTDLCFGIKDIEFIIEKNYNINCRYTVSAKDSHRIMYVKGGKAELRFCHMSLIVEKGDIIVLYPHEEYTLKSCGTENWTFSAIAFCPSAVFPKFERVIKLQNPFKYESYFQRAFSIWQQRSAGYKLYISSLLYMIFYDLLKESEKCQNNTYIEKVKNYINSNYTNKLTLKELASVSGYSVSYFKVCFVKNTGISPMRYINILRIEHAKELLGTGLYTVSETARECGFENLYYFSNVFKKITGIRPSNY